MGNIGKETRLQQVHFFQFLGFKLPDLEIVFELAAVQIVPAPGIDGDHHTQGIQGIGPAGFPPGRGNDDLQLGRGFIPDAVVIGPFHPEGISAGVQIGKGNLMIRTQLDSVIIEAFQLVSVFVVVAIPIA